MAKLGLAVRRRREARGWTPFRLARRAGISDAQLRTLERGEATRLGVEIAGRLAHALGTSVDVLLAEAGAIRHEEAADFNLEDALPALTDLERDLVSSLCEYLLTLRGAL